MEAKLAGMVLAHTIDGAVVVIQLFDNDERENASVVIHSGRRVFRLTLDDMIDMIE